MEHNGIYLKIFTAVLSVKREGCWQVSWVIYTRENGAAIRCHKPDRRIPTGTDPKNTSLTTRLSGKGKKKNDVDNMIPFAYIKNTCAQGLPWWSSGKDSAFIMQESWVRALVRELDSRCHRSKILCYN